MLRGGEIAELGKVGLELLDVRGDGLQDSKAILRPCIREACWQDERE
jgi:hypothetical protein